MTITYKAISKEQVPKGVRFDITRRNAGQIVEIAFGGFGSPEHDYGDPYKRVIDRSDRSVTFFALEKTKGAAS